MDLINLNQWNNQKVRLNIRSIHRHTIKLPNKYSDK